MLFAYTITPGPAREDIATLRDALDELNEQMLPESYGLMPLWHAVSATGPMAGSLRGYETDVSRGHMIAVTQVLRELSRRFPGMVISLSGGHGLLPTQIEAGEFGMFAEAYDRALSGRTGWITPEERVLRIPS